MKKVDLHTHTKVSDGENTPAQNVRLAKDKDLAAVAITDHDTVMGIAEAVQEGEKLGVEVIPGVEISALAQGQDIHVLGYYIDYMQQSLHQELKKLRKTRNKRNVMMVEKLQELGVSLTLEEVNAKQTHEEGNVGRPHIAEVLLDKGIVGSMEEAFEQYLGKNGKAYVNPPRISPQEAVRLILSFGGIPVLAHPGLYDADELIGQLAEEGLKGIEVYHPDHTEEDVQRYEKMTRDLQLIATGGSDFHGKRGEETYHAPMGSQPVYEDVLHKLKP